MYDVDQDSETHIIPEPLAKRALTEAGWGIWGVKFYCYRLVFHTLRKPINRQDLIKFKKHTAGQLALFCGRAIAELYCDITLRYSIVIVVMTGEQRGGRPCNAGEQVFI